jgi:gluconokinase
MPPALLESQLATLEPPSPDEHAVTIDVSGTVPAEADELFAQLGLQANGATKLGALR